MEDSAGNNHDMVNSSTVLNPVSVHDDIELKLVRRHTNNSSNKASRTPTICGPSKQSQTSLIPTTTY